MTALHEADVLDALVESAAASLCLDLDLHRLPGETAVSALSYALGPDVELLDVPRTLRLFSAAVLASAESGGPVVHEAVTSVDPADEEALWASVIASGPPD